MILLTRCTLKLHRLILIIKAAYRLVGNCSYVCPMKLAESGYTVHRYADALFCSKLYIRNISRMEDDISER